MTAPLGGFKLDSTHNTLLSGDREIQLSPLAARLLEILAGRPGETVARAELIEALWRGDWLVGDPALSRVISEIRTAIGDDPKRATLIQTVPRQGYRLVATMPPAGAKPSARSTFAWPVAWGLANRTLLIVSGGLSVLTVLAILARHYR